MAADRLLCAWCGRLLSAVEGTIHESRRVMQRWGWHPWCEDADPCTDMRVPWHERLATIAARGEGRIGAIQRGEEGGE